MMKQVQLPVVQNINPHLSFSELGVWEDCQWRWHLEKLHDLHKDESSFELVYGNAAHFAMELLFGKDPPPDTEIYRQFVEKLDADLLSAAPDGVLSEEWQKKYNECTPSALLFIDDVRKIEELQGAEPLLSEMNLYENISRSDEISKHFKGFVDIIFTRKVDGKTKLLICDFKTCSWGWPKSKSKDLLVQAQLLLYKHFLCKKFEVDPADVDVAFILLKKKPKDKEPGVQFVPITSESAEIETALNLLQRAITGMHSGTFTKNTKACVKRWGKLIVKCPFLRTDKCSSGKH